MLYIDWLFIGYSIQWYNSIYIVRVGRCIQFTSPEGVVCNHGNDDHPSRKRWRDTIGADSADSFGPQGKFSKSNKLLLLLQTSIKEWDCFGRLVLFLAVCSD